MRSLALLVLLAPAPSAAQVVLDWGAPESCIDAEGARAGAIARVGRDPFVESGGAMRITVRGDATGPVLSLRFVLADAQGQALGERVLTSAADCRAIDREIAIVLSLLVEAGEAQVALAIPVPPEPEPPPIPEPPPPPIPIEPAYRLVLGLRANGALSMIAAASAGGELFAGIAIDAFELRIEAIGLAGGDPISDAPSIASIAFGAALRACGALAGEDVALGACGSVGFALLRAHGENLAISREVDAPALWIGAGLRLVFRIDRAFAIEAELDGNVPVLRPTFHYDRGAGLAFEPWPVSPSLSIGARLEWGT